MGCDGGTIPRRDELVKTKKKKEAKDKNAEIAGKWKYCSISSNKLQRPIVSCELGRLYNKEAIIEYILNKESPNSSMLSHIRSLKDVTTLNLTKREQDPNKAGSSIDDSQHADYVCPISGLEMNGNYKFFFSRNCGCVFSERALKQVKMDTCLVCNASFDQNDLITLNGNNEEVDQLQQRMLERRSKEKEKKKKRKHENGDADNEDSRSKNKSAKTNGQDAAVATVKASTLTTLTEKASKGYSVNKDPTASEAYKSLFTTHESAKNRPKAHWVTYNPCYN